MIYFIRDKLTGLVKIGYSTEPWRRLNKIQADCPGELEMIALVAGTLATEQALHEAFRGSRFRGEWFTFDGVVEAYVSDALAPKKPSRESNRQRAIAALSCATGVPQSTVVGWIKRDRIPAGYWIKIDAAGVLTLQQLVASVTRGSATGVCAQLGWAA